MINYCSECHQECDIIASVDCSFQRGHCYRGDEECHCYDNLIKKSDCCNADIEDEDEHQIYLWDLELEKLLEETTEEAA